MNKPMDTPWDNGAKRLLDEAAQDFLDWVLQGAFFTGQRSQEFESRPIELAKIPYEELLAKGLAGILPLVPLSLDGAKREVVEEVIRRLMQPGEPVRKELLALTRLFASLAFKNQADQEWLKRRFEMLKDILRETPAFQQILEEGREEGRQKGREEGLELERQRHLLSLRQKLLDLVRVRYVGLVSLTQEKLSLITDLEALEDLFFKIAIAPTEEEARTTLLK